MNRSRTSSNRAKGVMPMDHERKAKLLRLVRTVFIILVLIALFSKGAC